MSSCPLRGKDHVFVKTAVLLQSTCTTARHGAELIRRNAVGHGNGITNGMYLHKRTEWVHSRAFRIPLSNFMVQNRLLAGRSLHDIERG